MLADGAKSAMVMMAMRRRRLAAIRRGVTDFARQDDRRPYAAARKSNTSVRRKHEGQGLQKQQASDGAREKTARRTSRKGPIRRHTPIGRPLTSQVNGEASGKCKYSLAVAEMTHSNLWESPPCALLAALHVCSSG